VIVGVFVIVGARVAVGSGISVAVAEGARGVSLCSRLDNPWLFNTLHEEINKLSRITIIFFVDRGISPSVYLYPAMLILLILYSLESIFSLSWLSFSIREIDNKWTFLPIESIIFPVSLRNP
jgi:hypothetical protein